MKPSRPATPVRSPGAAGSKVTTAGVLQIHRPQGRTVKASPILRVALALPCAAADYPEAQISNGVLQVKLLLPDAQKGYYRGTRFDWSGDRAKGGLTKGLPGLIDQNAVWGSHARLLVTWAVLLSGQRAHSGG